MITLFQTLKPYKGAVIMLRNKKIVHVTNSSLIRLIRLWSKPNYFEVYQRRVSDRVSDRLVTFLFQQKVKNDCNCPTK